MRDMDVAEIDRLDADIAACDRELRELKLRDERIERLQQVPGIADYCGLAPTVRQSADKTYRGSLRPDCNHWLRYAFIEAAHSCARSSGRYREYHDRKLERRDKKVATVATARRLCRLVFAMLWSGEDYRADRDRAA